MDGDYETWAEEFKNDNFEDELYFENGDNVEEEEQREQLEDETDQNDDTKQKLTTH